MQNTIREYIGQHYEAALQIIRDLCAIPAPSHHEENRAAWCKAWLDENCGSGAYIDEALNVIYPMNCEGKDAITVVVAHTDTVFPDTEPMPFSEDEEKMYSPGIADDTASVAVLLLTVKFFRQQNLCPEGGILFVCNSCEEGLGNLKGTRQLFKDFAGRIGQFLTFDSSLNYIADRCVGSHRYEVEVKTQGGHSFGNFGRKNAIAELAKIACGIYALEVPQKEGEKTTYNVGIVEGGTSVNTIAQSAKMLCEYRSSDKDCMAYMQEKFMEIFESARSEEVQVEVTMVGDRPCADIEEEKVEAFKTVIAPAIESAIGKPVRCTSSSTDCNVPLSVGIPALCVGVCRFGGAHTREEWLEKASLIPGLEIGIKVSMAAAGMQ